MNNNNSLLVEHSQNQEGIGIYIHIPFCVHKCVYCDFLSAPADDETKAKYVKALNAEIGFVTDQLRDKLKDKKVKTVFIGGGTPTVLESKCIVEILDEIRKHFPVEEDAEITIECNPGTINVFKAKDYKEAGINRISFGLQSSDDNMLRMLGRIHRFEDFEDGIRTVRECGITNINVDIMSALPGQNVESYVNGLKKVLSYNPTHISSYSLIVEEGTYLCDNLDKFPPLPKEEEERQMYYETDKVLTQYGYERYEISNYSKPGFYCKHNLSYWDRDEYLGFGIGAASYFGGVRYSNIADINRYINKAGSECVYEEPVHLSEQDAMEEFMFLGLRKVEGVSFSKFKKEFSTDIMNIYKDVIDKYTKTGFMEFVKKDGDYVGVKLTKKGIDVSNVVLSDFLI